MDFSRQSKRSANGLALQRGVIVEAYMAHHQGMAFMALTNQLHNNPFPRRFHGDPRVRAFETLLQERIPDLPPLHLISTRQSQPAMQARDLIVPAGNRFQHTPYRHPPDTSAKQRQLWVDGDQQRWRLQPMEGAGAYSLALGSDL